MIFGPILLEGKFYCETYKGNVVATIFHCSKLGATISTAIVINCDYYGYFAIFSLFEWEVVAIIVIDGHF